LREDAIKYFSRHHKAREKPR